MSAEEIFEKLKHLIVDENKVVTYKGLSVLMQIHVNRAKELLEKFFHLKTNEGLGAYYYISGTQKDENGNEVNKFSVVYIDEFEEKKHCFENLLCSHIYSVQKGKLRDMCILYSVDVSPGRPAEDICQFSAVKYSGAKVGKGQALTNVNNNNAVPETSKKSAVPEASKRNSSETKSVQPSKISFQGSEAKPKSQANKSPDMFSLWQKKNASKSAEDSSTNSHAKSSKEKTTEKKISNRNIQDNQVSSSSGPKESKNSLKSLFSKQAEKTVSKPCIPEVSQKAETKIQSKTENVQSISKVKEPVKRKSGGKRPKNVKRRSNSDSDEDMKPKQKRHKRIVAMSDSDSESENEENRDKLLRSCSSRGDLEDPFASLDIDDNNTDKGAKKSMNLEDPFSSINDEDDEIVPPTPPVNSGKKKKWKVLTKTFEDEDGFLVTKNVKEYVTASEESDTEEPVKSKIKTHALEQPVSKSNFINKKQASLMNFFKQK